VFILLFLVRRNGKLKVPVPVRWAREAVDLFWVIFSGKMMFVINKMQVVRIWLISNGGVSEAEKAGKRQPLGKAKNH
jgi:hypothetical protein